MGAFHRRDISVFPLLSFVYRGVLLAGAFTVLVLFDLGNLEGVALLTLPLTRLQKRVAVLLNKVSYQGGGQRDVVLVLPLLLTDVDLGRTLVLLSLHVEERAGVDKFRKLGEAIGSGVEGRFEPP